MNHYGTLSALQPILHSLGITMRRCRRRLGDESLYYLTEDNRKNIVLSDSSKTHRQGYSLVEILNWLCLTADASASQKAHLLLMQLNEDSASLNNFS